MPLTPISSHKHNGKDSPILKLKDLDFVGATFDQFDTAKQALVTAPTGGAVIDAESRTAINNLITRLETLGLIETN